MAEATRPTVTVRLFAGARAAAGTRQADIQVGSAVDGQVGGEVGSEVDGGAAGTAGPASVQDVLDGLVASYPGVARVLPACSYLLDGVAARPAQPLGQARTLDVLPPFSGG
ncbi:hypothetical protein [Aquipuribacter hungaricus]|uniref:MoaD/ThiS family protein n=1 Tax=Aquipuribacter hungaricus TaxID=545624 RepID=A0ABV7WB79_9MICO